MGDYDRFDIWDYVVFISTVVISFSIGVFFAIWDRNRDTPLNYFLAGRKYGFGPISLSFIVTFQSSLTIIGLPAEVYLYGMVQTYSVLGILASYIVSGIILVPVLHPLKLTSVHRYFEMRYHGSSVRYLTFVIGILYNTCYMGAVTFGTCVALDVVMGIPYWATIVLYTAITTTYTAIGGIKAVIWSDVFQLIIMATGIVALLVKATLDSGGLSEVLAFSADRLKMNDFRLNPTIRYQFWNVSFGAFSRFFFFTCTQSGVQRINSTSSVKSSRAIYIIAAPLYCVFYLLCALQGVSFFAYYSKKGCDPIESGRAENYNQLVPLAVLDLFRNIPGLAGLFIASLSSGALSTLSSCLSSLTAITYDDIILEKFPNISDRKATLVSKLIAFAYGIIAFIVAFAISKLSGTLIAVYMAFMGCLNGPYSAIVLLSIVSRRITSTGTFIGGIVGVIATFWLIIGQTLTKLPQSYKLPPGPIDQCPSQQIMNETMLAKSSFTTDVDHYAVSDSTFAFLSSTTETSAASGNILSPLERLYSISHALFSLIGFLATIVVAIGVSFFTSESVEIDEKCLFSFKRHVLSQWRREPVKGTAGESADVEENHELMPQMA